MKPILKFFKLTLVGGALVVLPLWVALLLLLKAMFQVVGLVKPISAELPTDMGNPDALAIVLMVLVCFAVGLVVQTVVGRQAQEAVEKVVFARIPGYKFLSNVGKQIADVQHNHGFKPALFQTDEGLVPAFIVEALPEGKFTLFLPSAPTPLAGSIMITDGARVFPVDISVPQAFACISKWGTGAGEMYAKIHRDPPLADKA